MATISGSLSGNGVSATLATGNVRDEITVAISGTFNAKVYFERAQTTDASAWARATGSLLSGTSTRVQAGSKDIFRVRVQDFVSGTISYTASIGDTVLESRYDADNGLMYSITRNTIYTPKDIVTDGAIIAEGVTLGQLVLDHGAVVSSPKNIDTDTSRVHKLVLETSPIALTFSTSAAEGAFRSILVFMTQGTGGIKDVTYPENVRWQGGFSPSLSTAEGATDVLQIMTLDGGVSWIAGITYQVAAL